ncbi:Protein of unknown function [Chryseobacterium sp. RU37D]|uniref:DUF3828 domain-containing protein n=1 Tax=Chryseobacterium sp. RU37D TaxID=1907397 RepID=UPI0009556FDA|nr:DUF3828 domain-containing protein [Chryseobacterium sp. RU37D]SIQ32711.1 Protein of unknown function [Chryseobacterium sp. RU37D]
MKQLFYLGAFFALSACKKNDPVSKAVNNDAEITQRVNEMYTIYGKSSDAIYKSPFADSIFSPSLKQTLNNAKTASEKSIKMTKEGKPQVFEGSVFTSLYEGYTTYKINSVKMIGDSKLAKAEVSIEFENSAESPKIIWTDKVDLINSGDGWKVDNIEFDKKINVGDLKQNLKKFTEGVQ